MFSVHAYSIFHSLVETWNNSIQHGGSVTAHITEYNKLPTRENIHIHKLHTVVYYMVPVLQYLSEVIVINSTMVHTMPCMPDQWLIEKVCLTFALKTSVS